MAVRRPIVRVNGQLTELPTADSLPGAGGAGISENLRAIVEAAAHAFNNNCRTRPVVADPPLITIGTATPPAAHTRIYTFGATGQPFVSCGGRPTTASGRTTFPVVTPSSTRVDFCWRVETVVDSDSVGFLLDSATADGYRFIVDGQYVSLVGTASAAGSERYYRLQWPTKARREVIVEGNTNLGFWGAAVPDDGQCILPHNTRSPRLFFVGDSNAALQGFNQKGDCYPFALADYLGIRDVWTNAITATGFATAGGGNSYGGRRDDWTTLTADSVDILVFQLSYNDYSTGVPDATLQAAVATEITQARAAHPNAIIIIHGNNSWNDDAGSTAGLTAHEVAAAAAVTAAADPLVLFLPIYSATGQTLPITGQSAAGDTGTGNTPRYVSHAADHMSPAGNVYFGQWLARRFIDLLATAAGIPSVELTPPLFPEPLAPTDYWTYSHVGNNAAAASDLFTGAAISTGTNNTALPAAAQDGIGHDGVLLRSSTTANSGYRYAPSSRVGMTFGGTSRKFRGHFRWRTAFTGTTVRIGFHDTDTSADATDGAYFEIVAATCSAKTANNTARTTAPTTATLSLDVYYTFDIDVNQAGTAARFRVYAGNSSTPVLDQTITTNIPANTARSFSANLVATNSGTTAVDLGIFYGMGQGTVPGFRRSMGP